ncbi:MAG: hypothetical protein ABIK92_14100 [Pseudomonadota bacterium]
MMKNVKFLVASVVMLLFIMSFIIVNPGTINAAEKDSDKCYVVSLRGSLRGNISQQSSKDMDPIVKISPQDLTVSAGSCVVWVNWIRGAEISTSFQDGKVCADKTKSSMSFRLTPGLGCYVTNFLVQGETSSLRFMEPGTYKYDIYTQSRTAPLASGQIIVK